MTTTTTTVYFPPALRCIVHLTTETVEGSVWFYQPNKIAPPIFAALFMATALVHAYQTWLYKSWKMTLLLPWGALLMIAGFGVREAGAYHIGNVKLLIASTVLLLSGP